MRRGKMNIYLVRHGSKEEGLFNEDLNLSELGCRQADITGQRLKKYNIDIIYSSHLKRAIQTAEVINQHLNVKIEKKEYLREIFFGDMELKDNAYVKEHYSEFYKQLRKLDGDIPYPNGECGEDVCKRVKSVLDEVKEKKYENVVIVAHGGTIRALISCILDMNPKDRLLIGVPLENCSISIVKFNESYQKYCIHMVNDYSHLESIDVNTNCMF